MCMALALAWIAAVWILVILLGDMIIQAIKDSRIRVKRVLTDAEVERICWTRFSVHSQPHRPTAERKGA